MNKRKLINIARQVTVLAVQNSEVVQPYVKPKYYRRLLMGLNAINMALRLADK